MPPPLTPPHPSLLPRRWMSPPLTPPHPSLPPRRWMPPPLTPPHPSLPPRALAGWRDRLPGGRDGRRHAQGDGGRRHQHVANEHRHYQGRPRLGLWQLSQDGARCRACKWRALCF
eukprot:22932-Chlamydomonas_euryale.AAC.3